MSAVVGIMAVRLQKKNGHFNNFLASAMCMQQLCVVISVAVVVLAVNLVKLMPCVNTMYIYWRCVITVLCVSRLLYIVAMCMLQLCLVISVVVVVIAVSLDKLVLCV